MDETIARNTFLIVLAVIAGLLLGDYLGYKMGRRRLVTFLGIIALLAVIVFAVYAAVIL